MGPDGDLVLGWGNERGPDLRSFIAGGGPGPQQPPTDTGRGGSVTRLGELDWGEDIENEPREASGFLVIKTDPPNANVWINGEQVGRGTVQLEKMVGTYRIVAERGEAYLPDVRDVNLTEEGVRLTLEVEPDFGELAGILDLRVHLRGGSPLRR